ncbi:MAG: hypothetical protein MR779_00040 [Tenericutes bacterium]|nr:hypothetical protein [Mycoplasmatota bacterium]
MSFIIIFSISSIIASFTMEFKNVFKFYKSIGEAGYKFNASRSKEVSKMLNSVKKYSIFKLFIPGYNVIYEAIRTKAYTESINVMLRQLEVMGVIEDMTPDEIERFEDNPTGSELLKISVESRLMYEKELADMKANSERNEAIRKLVEKKIELINASNKAKLEEINAPVKEEEKDEEESFTLNKKM